MISISLLLLILDALRGHCSAMSRIIPFSDAISNRRRLRISIPQPSSSSSSSASLISSARNRVGMIITTTTSQIYQHSRNKQHSDHRRRRNIIKNDDSCSNTIVTTQLLLTTRGGATSTVLETSVTTNANANQTTTLKKKSASKKAKTKKKKKKKSTADTKPLPSKDLINDKLKDEDSAAQSLGDAIRQNAHLILSSSNYPYDEDHDQTTLESLGHAMGSSDYTTSVLSQYSKQPLEMNSSSIRRTKSKMAQELTSPTAVIVHYFLKSHGGIHILQCTCSLLASLAGMGSLLLYHSRTLQYTLVQRTLFFGMCKHISGVLMAIYLVARSISRPGGFHEARQSIQSLIRDPISQYVFYTACVLLWLPSSTVTTITSKAIPPPSLDGASSVVEKTMAASALNGLVWCQQYSWVPLVLVGPVVLREFISIALVVSDVLTLIIATTTGTDSSTTTYIERLLKVTHAIVNATMSILVTPQKWRSSNAAQRQALLARLVSKISLLLEVGVGILMLCDCLVMSMRYLFVNTGGQIRFYSLMKSMICTRLYIGFLWTRRKNISKLAESMRGGAIEAPIYVLDILLHPTVSMGIASTSQSLPATPLTKMNDRSAPNKSPDEPVQVEHPMENQRRWMDYVRIALDMDNP
jgi:hypothetical protein